jgi:hypothetical protein
MSQVNAEVPAATAKVPVLVPVVVKETTLYIVPPAEYELVVPPVTVTADVGTTVCTVPPDR